MLVTNVIEPGGLTSPPRILTLKKFYFGDSDAHARLHHHAHRKFLLDAADKIDATHSTLGNIKLGF